MNILIITGPAAAGKNTVAKLLAKQREKCAVIDVDLVRWMYLHPHKAPWEREEGKAQQKLGVENTCLLAQNFVNHAIDVIILDVITNETAAIYRHKFPTAKIILLMPTYEEAHTRFLQRPHSISDEEFTLVYQWQEQLTAYDEKIDNTQLSAEETARALNLLFVP